MKLTPYFRSLLLATPLTILTLVPFIALAGVLDIEISLRYAAFGALGWWVALLLRAPVALLASRLGQQKGQSVIVMASGPAEEIVRCALLLTIGLTVENGYAVGLGWAAIEVVYALVQGAAMGALEQKTDQKAEEAKAMLRTMGMDKAMTPTAPYWGALERVSANALHISFSLLLVVSPYLVLLTAPLHSCLNILITRLLKRSMARAELVMLGLAAVLFAAALALAAAK